jgi:hypothetical protein
VIAGIVLAFVGAIFCALSILEIAFIFWSTGGATQRVVRSLTGRHEADVSQMEQAMAWVHVFGFLLVGGVMLAAGLGILGA